MLVQSTSAKILKYLPEKWLALFHLDWLFCKPSEKSQVQNWLFLWNVKIMHTLLHIRSIFLKQNNFRCFFTTTTQLGNLLITVSEHRDNIVTLLWFLCICYKSIRRTDTTLINTCKDDNSLKFSGLWPKNIKD